MVRQEKPSTFSTVTVLAGESNGSKKKKRAHYWVILLDRPANTISFLYIKLKEFFKRLSKKKWSEIMREQFFNPNESDAKKALSIGLGSSIGIMPIWGFQTLLALFLSVVLKLNKALTLLATQISIPPMIPLILWASYRTGALLVKHPDDHAVSAHAVQYLYGSTLLSLTTGVAAGITSFTVLKISRRRFFVN